MNHVMNEPLFGKQVSQESIQESRNQAKDLKIPEWCRRKFRVSDPSGRTDFWLRAFPMQPTVATSIPKRAFPATYS